VFISFFLLEATLKLIGFGVRFYFLDTWNRFDFLIVLLSIIAIDADLFQFKVTALRIIRVARLLRMVKSSKGLKNLLKALWLSLKNIVNVGMILFLIFFTFSVAGMDLFGQIVMG
jgi:Ion transport protein